MQPTPAFSINVRLPREDPVLNTPEKVEIIKQISALKYGRKKELVDKISELYPLEPIESSSTLKHETAKNYQFKDGIGRVGFISSVSEPFCDDCNRVRLTADGKFRNCLFATEETDLLTPLRKGASDEELRKKAEMLIRAYDP